MTLVLKRRILNAILTVYLPTILVLTIVYATNFFKDFFFEATVTVNLTSLLVLTTLFISVAGSLPQTAYVKMVDIWLIFAQVILSATITIHIVSVFFSIVPQTNPLSLFLRSYYHSFLQKVVPWIEVLLHTLIDFMRTEGEEGREVNHHGKTITVGGKVGTRIIFAFSVTTPIQPNNNFAPFI